MELTTVDLNRFIKCSDGGYCIFEVNRDFVVKYASQELLTLLHTNKLERLRPYLEDGCSTAIFNKCVESTQFNIKTMLKTTENSLVPVTLACTVQAGVIYCLVITQLDWYEANCSAIKACRQYDKLLEWTSSCLFETDLDWNLICCTNKMIEMFPDLKPGASLKKLFTNSNVVDKQCSTAIEHLFSVDGVFNFDISEKIRLVTRDNSKWYSINIQSVVDKKTNCINAIAGSLFDIDTYENTTSQLNSKLAKDDLTGCFSKAYLLSDRVASTLSTDSYVLFFDIDNFKGINDTYGHLLGDAVLKDVSSIAKEIFCGMPGLVCRFGGDEFCVYCPSITREKMGAAASKLRRECKRINVDGDFPISISGGIGKYTPESDTVPSIIEAADNALYYAKENGKDNIVFCKQ